MEKGAISGTIFDPSGAVVPGADVTVINTSTGAERVLISNEAGRFRADILQAGEYGYPKGHPFPPFAIGSSAVGNRRSCLARGEVFQGSGKTAHGTLLGKFDHWSGQRP